MTAAGRSAVAVARVWGVGCEAVVDACFEPASLHPMRPGQIRYGLWRSTGESVVVTPVGKGDVEVHCHGGIAAIAKVIEDLVAAGCERAEVPFESDDPHGQLAMQVASRCRTARTAAIAMDQVRGAYSRWLASDQRDPTPEQIDSWAKWSTRLDEPFRVVLAGPPNVGKSSLINAIVGYERAITMDLPGTTRDVLRAETVLDGWPILLMDTAGLRQATDDIEREGVSRASAALSQADLVVWVRDGDASLPIDPTWPAVVRVCNKIDAGATPGSGELGTSTVTGQGLEVLQNAIVGTLVPNVPPPGSPVRLV